MEKSQTLRPSKTIEIDDSGTGDLVGNAFIGFHVIETGKIIFKSVPVGLYNIKNWKNDEPSKRIAELIEVGLKELDFNKETDLVQICRGQCFNLTREYFDKEGIKHEPAIVEGALQDAVEGRLVSHLRKLGVKSNELTMESGSKRYFVLFKWVCRDFPNRVKYVKTGFPSWSKKFKEQAITAYEKYYSRKKVKIS